MRVILIFTILAIAYCTTQKDDLVDKTYLKSINIDIVEEIYSGYLPVTDDSQTQFHYFFVLSDKTKPLTLWLNGGPGCSSLQGLLNENGPVSFIAKTTTLRPNPYSWTKASNMLYLETPINVGFSYGPDGFNQLQTDLSTAKYNVKALVQFLSRFTDFKDSEFYISGESYAGVCYNYYKIFYQIYIPTLANQIIDYNTKNPTIKINLKGLMIGNGCTDPSECTDAGQAFQIHRTNFLGQHNLISEGVHTQAIDAQDQCYGSDSDTCGSILTQVEKEFSNDKFINPYNVYGDCAVEVIPLLDSKIMKSSPLSVSDYLFKPHLRETADLPPCADALGLYNLTHNSTFKTAFHINKNSPSWNVCGKINYTKDDRGSYYLYESLIKSGLRIWKFSGDTDAVVPITGTLFWINKLQNEYSLRTLVPWRAWYKDGVIDKKRQNAGNYWRLNGLTFVSVRGAGHMVPTDQPQSALDMFQAFLQGADLPKM